MKKQEAVKRMSRREFLIGAGAALASAMLACGRGRVGDTGEAPPVSGTAVPVLTPVADSPPIQITPIAPPELAADTVFVGGKVITVDEADTIAQAVAIKDGLIHAVGSDAEIAALAGEATRVIDLRGRAVTPGLIDSHNHFQVVGLLNSYYTPFLPPDIVTVEQLQAALAEAVAGKPDGEWVIGYFLFIQGVKLPTRHELDPVTPNHPVWIVQQGGHYGSANSLALQMAGITAETPDPPGGMIGRDPGGEPNGVFYNHRAMDLLRKVVPMYTTDDVRNNIASTQPLFASCGVTSFHDNNVRGVDNVATYLDVGKQGQMVLRGAVYYTLEWPTDLDRALYEMEHDYADDFMRFAGFKFLLDGQLTMAYCHEPHNGERWDMPTWDPQGFKDAVRALHDTGLQICVHCAGDAAVDLTLDAFEEAMDANPRPDPRHRIEHAVITTPQATQRMRDLGVVVCTQPQFIRLAGDGYADLFGEERAKRAIVTREWLENGVALALSSDAPSTPWFTPHATLIGAVARLTYSNKTYESDQCLTIQEALRAHTMGSAYAGHEEHVRGSIEVGKMADLVVWSTDPYAATLKQLWEMVAEMTVVGGEIVYAI
ncbi:MAG: amidohydrolase family protein [Anaerolineae bacterium]|nr:amidohydrolase family protein [Anaerolineae bacterium]